MTLTRLFTHSGRRRTTRAAALLLVVGATGLVAGCSKTVREGQSPGYLVLRALEAASGADDGEFSTVLRSDVFTKNSIFEDNGRVTLTLAMRDISVTAPTSNNLVTLTRYRVQYRRTDGRNTPGEDVPFPVEGGLGVTVGEQETSAVFSIVRAQAKLERPLVTLRGGNGALVISTIADVTFFGKDQTGRDVTVSGSISVNFADWADKD